MRCKKINRGFWQTKQMFKLTIEIKDKKFLQEEPIYLQLKDKNGYNYRGKKMNFSLHLNKEKNNKR